MKRKLFFTALLWLNIIVAFGQKTEAYLSLNSGLFSFAGASAFKESAIDKNAANSIATLNPFGAKNGLSYGLSFRGQKISKRNFIVGIDVGYDNLRSKVTIVRILSDVFAPPPPDRDLGKTILSNHFINASPYLGYRIATTPVGFDLTAGLEFGYLIAAHERGKAALDVATYRTSRRVSTGTKFDIRPKLQLTALYHRVGVYAGYAHGLPNYLAGYDGGNPEARSRLIRFGILYKIKG